MENIPILFNFDLHQRANFASFCKKNLHKQIIIAIFVH